MSVHVLSLVSLSDDITMVICPGIGNHSEKNYIRTFVDHSQRQGYRCAVLNHLGALPNMELTSPRMFTYGKDLIMVKDEVSLNYSVLHCIIHVGLFKLVLPN